MTCASLPRLQWTSCACTLDDAVVVGRVVERSIVVGRIVRDGLGDLDQLMGELKAATRTANAKAVQHD